jgi:uncharacterized metal-binding protein YceD (DUF177 family)
MTTEFSRIIDTSLLAQGKESLLFSATPDECKAIAKRLSVRSLQKFETTVKIIPLEMDPFVQLDIVLNAQLTQTCGVSLKDVDESVYEPFSLLLSHKEETTTLSIDDELGHEEHETIYMGPEDLLDLGEILVQYLSLAINPYPRHPDADTPEQTEPIGKESPFAKLKDLDKKG